MADFPDDAEPTGLVAQAAGGDGSAWAALLERHRGRLRRMVELRLDRRVRSRIDPSDVIQEACLDASRRLPAYAADPRLPFFLWLRGLVGQRLVDAHRRHLGAAARDAGRDVTLHQGQSPEANSATLAARLLGRLTSPSDAADRNERKTRLLHALDRLAPADREILALRHYEQLGNGEAAAVLGLDKSAASKRYARALVRLKAALGPLSGVATGSRP